MYKMDQIYTIRELYYNQGFSLTEVAEKVNCDWRTVKKYIEEVLGWKRHSCCEIGSSKRTHLTESELPNGVLIVQVSRHLTCVKDRVLHDTYDCSRDGTRMVYGYWSKD